MTRDEHKAEIQKLFGMIAPDHQAAASEILNGLSNDYETTQNTLDNANANVQTLTQNNENLRAANTKLFLQLGSTPKPEDKPGKNPPPTQDEKPLTFESLFNEKGDLI